MSDAMLQWDGFERRQGPDRRGRHSWQHLLLLLRGQRIHARRAVDAADYYVDRYDAKLLLVSLTIVLLCCFDAIFTLHLIYLGVAEEANPFMRLMLENSTHLFFATKFALTAFGLVVLVVHKNFRIYRWVTGLHILYGFLIMYALLIKYELWLFSLAGA